MLNRRVVAGVFLVVLEGVAHRTLFLGILRPGPDGSVAAGDDVGADGTIGDIRAAGHLAGSLVHLVGATLVGGATGEQGHRSGQEEKIFQVHGLFR